MSVGEPIVRKDGRAKVTGSARYAADHRLDGLVHAVAVGATIARGKITSIETGAAKKARGVADVITHRNAPALRRVTGPDKFGPAGETLLPLQGDRIFYGGQAVAVVVARTLEEATHAAGLIEVTYDRDRPVASLDDGLDDAFTSPAAPPATKGDVEKAFKGAAVRLDRTYRTQMQHHHPIEPLATIADWRDDELTVYDATQSVFHVRDGLATMFGIEPEQVRVVSRFLGGGFGAKGFLWWPTVLAVMAARRAGRPVKLVVTRAQMVAAAGHRSRSRQRVRLGASRTGELAAVAHDSVSETSSWYDTPPDYIGAATMVPYACADLAVTSRFVRVNAMTPTPMRSPSEGVGLFGLESAIDELAAGLGIDPLRLRLRNFAERDPLTGKQWSSNGLLECYERGAARFGWDRRDPRPGSMRDGGHLVGWGMAGAIRFVGRAPTHARARINADGTAVMQIGSQDLGTGTYTIMAQVAADAMGMPVAKVTASLGDTDLPVAPPSYGSTTAGSVGPAAEQAGTAVRKKAIEIAVRDDRSPLHGADPSAILAKDGRLYLRDQPSRGETYARLLRRNGMDAVSATAEFTPPAPGEGEVSMFAFGADFAEVRVDPALGTVRVSRYVKAVEAGRILNPRTARSQISGGVIWGIGQALTERTEMDSRHALVVNTGLWDYHVPVNADVPGIDVIFVERDDPHIDPPGMKGLGELATIGTAPAIANAVYHATGRRIRDLPITPDRLAGGDGSRG